MAPGPNMSKVFTLLVDSICARINTSTEQWEFPEVAGRNAKANMFWKESARFKIIIDLNK
jgi:hypothetical protein